MIGFGKSVYGVAGTADVIAATVIGRRAGSAAPSAVLAQALLSDSAAALFTPTETTDTAIESVTLVNTSGSTVSDIQVYIGSTDYPITGKFSLGAYGWAVVPASGLATIYTATGATPTVGMLADDGSTTGATGAAQPFTEGVTTAKTVALTEMTAPTGTANVAKIFAVDSGGGKTILKVIFGTGAAQTIATEP